MRSDSPTNSVATDFNFNASIDLTGVPDIEEPADSESESPESNITNRRNTNDDTAEAEEPSNTKSESSEAQITNHCHTDNHTVEGENTPTTETRMKLQKGPTGHLFRFHVNEKHDRRFVSRTWHPVKSFWDMTRSDLEEGLPESFGSGQRQTLEFNIIGKSFFRDFFLYSQEDYEFEDLKFDFQRYIMDMQLQGSIDESTIFIEIKVARDGIVA